MPIDCVSRSLGDFIHFLTVISLGIPIGVSQLLLNLPIYWTRNLEEQFWYVLIFFVFEVSLKKQNTCKQIRFSFVVKQIVDDALISERLCQDFLWVSFGNTTARSDQNPWYDLYQITETI